jgi:hypothetical protein
VLRESGDEMSRAKKTKLQRERITKLITPVIRQFAKDGDEQTIGMILCHGVMWLSNNTTRDLDTEARTLIALLSIVEIDEFELTADMTIFYREMAKGCAHDAATAIARRILQPLGVRYAACGCLEQCASDDCCEIAMDAKESREIGQSMLAAMDKWAPRASQPGNTQPGGGS